MGGRNSANVLWALIFPIIPSCSIPYDLVVAVTSLLNVSMSLKIPEFHSCRISLYIFVIYILYITEI